MGPAPARFVGGDLALTPQRAAVLELVQGAARPVTVEDVAASLGLHTNTARKHLAGLVDDGLLDRSVVASERPGRPATAYSPSAARSEHDPRVREYAGLAGALAGHIARTSHDPVADARAAGAEWGATLVAGEGAARSATAARVRVVALLEEMGFDPEPDARCARVRLRRCPLLDAALAHPDVVCEVHLGLVRGAMARLGADASHASLRPFAEPGACLLWLA